MALLWRDGRWLLDGDQADDGAVREARDAFLDAAADDLAALAAEHLGPPRRGPVRNAEWPEAAVAAWFAAFARRLTDLVVDAYATARGGVDAVPDAEWGDVLGLGERAVAFLDGFRADVAAGRLSPEQVAARSRLYGNDLVSVWERARFAQLGWTPPAFPGDHGTPCRGNCRCWWRLVEFEDRWEATWVVAGDAGTCAGCEERGRRWGPHVEPKVVLLEAP